MYNYFFWIIVIILISGHTGSLYLDRLNISMWSDKVPAKLANIINQDEYSRSQGYFLANRRFGHISATINLSIILAVLALGGFSILDEFIRNYFSNEILVSLLFFGLTGLLATLIGLPFSWYETFVIEEKFGFNRTSKITFFLDMVKGWMIGILIGGPILMLIIWIYYRTGGLFWIYMWLVITLFSVFMNMFYSELIVPLFNKQKPLEDGSLRDGIEKLAKSAGFRLTDIYTIDGSKRSTRANAYFTGLGPMKRIVLYDTLINDLDEEEIIAVLAHEIGHYRKKHSLSMLLAGILQTGFLLFIFSLFAGNDMLASALGAPGASFHISLIAFALIYSPVSTVISIILNYISPVVCD